MEYEVKQLNPSYDFKVTGVSYIGEPVSNTAMYITKKVEYLLENLKKSKNCLIFAEDGITIPEVLKKENCFSLSENPQRDYAEFVQMFANLRFEKDRKRKYTLMPGGYYIGENVSIGENAYIEPGCIIGHDVIIGKNTCILAGSIIKNAIIGDEFFMNENSVIGAQAFTMAEDENGNKFRIPALGKVRIGDHVEIGPQNNIACGSNRDTILENNVKLDGLVHIGHDAHLCKNVEVTAGGIFSGFVYIGEHAYTGVNACIRNRISIGSHCVIGMGATVVETVPPGVTVAGNPASTDFRDKK